MPGLVSVCHPPSDRVSLKEISVPGTRKPHGLFDDALSVRVENVELLLQGMDLLPGPISTSTPGGSEAAIS